VKGRKRQLLVDTEGFVLAAAVHAADLTDSDGGRFLLTTVAGRFPRLRHLWLDGGYRGRFVEWVMATLGWRAEVVQRDWRYLSAEATRLEEKRRPRGFVVLPRRWVVERTFAWLGKFRRLSKDYEALPETSEAWIYTAMSCHMLRRLATRHAK
jgi:putative transposase